MDRNSGFEAVRREVVPEIMVCDLRDPDRLASSCELLVQSFTREDRNVRESVQSLLLNFVPILFEKFEELIRDRDSPIRALRLSSLNPNLATIEVDVSPYYGPCFFDTGSGRSEKGRAINITRSKTFEDPSEILTRGDFSLFCVVLHAKPIHSSNVLDQQSAFDCDINCSRENGESSVDRRGRVPFKAVLSSGSDESGSILPKSNIPFLDVVIRYAKGSQIFEFGLGIPETLD